MLCLEGEEEREACSRQNHVSTGRKRTCRDLYNRDQIIEHDVAWLILTLCLRQ